MMAMAMDEGDNNVTTTVMAMTTAMGKRDGKGDVDDGGDGNLGCAFRAEFRRISNSGPFFDPISSNSGSGSDRISCSRQSFASQNYVPAKFFPNYFIGKLLPPFLLAW